MELGRALAWDTPETWPRDYRGYVYFGRFVARLGEIMFGDEWVPPGTDVVNAGGPFDVTGQGWALTLRRARQRLELQAHVIVMCEDERLATAYQAHSGELVTMPRHAWNVGPDAARFAYFRVNPKHFISRDQDGADFADMFVPEDLANQILQSAEEFFLGAGVSAQAVDMANAVPAPAAVSRPVFNLYMALLSNFRGDGGLGRKMAERKRRVEEWRLKQNPRPAFPRDIDREIRRLDDIAFSVGKSLICKDENRQTGK